MTISNKKELSDLQKKLNKINLDYMNELNKKNPYFNGDAYLNQVNDIYQGMLKYKHLFSVEDKDLFSADYLGKKKKAKNNG